jgi:hypothetical protein
LGYRAQAIRDAASLTPGWDAILSSDSLRLATFSAIALITAAAACSCHTSLHQHRFVLPGVVLWAWERPEDLRFIDPERTGVAFLAATASISRTGIVCFQPRMQRLELPVRAAVLAVVRVESPPQHPNVQAEALISGIRQIAALPNVRGIQIDFDARSSERELYSTLLEMLRTQTDKPIGITALASWCIGDQWLDREPIVEAVPMFFRMGRHESRDEIAESSVCRSSIGLSIDEPWPARRPGGIERIYLFSPHAWRAGDYRDALKRIQDWK